MINHIIALIYHSLNEFADIKEDCLIKLLIKMISRNDW